MEKETNAMIDRALYAADLIDLISRSFNKNELYIAVKLGKSKGDQFALMANTQIFAIKTYVLCLYRMNKIEGYWSAKEYLHRGRIALDESKFGYRFINQSYFWQDEKSRIEYEIDKCLDEDTEVVLQLQLRSVDTILLAFQECAFIFEDLANEIAKENANIDQ